MIHRVYSIYFQLAVCRFITIPARQTFHFSHVHSGDCLWQVDRPHYIRALWLQFIDWDLGVFVTTNVKPSITAKLAVSRARARLFQIRRGFVVMTNKAFLLLHLSLVRPILEYTIQAVSLDL